MKRLTTITLLATLLMAGPTYAANDSLIDADLQNYIGFGFIAFTLLTFKAIIGPLIIN